MTDFLSTTHKVSRPVMRYHGGKFRLAEWIMGFFPDHDTYVEPFGGAGSVLMRKPRSPAEVYNDLDDEIVNVFRVLRDPVRARRLKEVCTLTPYARSEFVDSYEASADPVEQARRTIFRAAAGFGSAGATKGRTGFRSYSKADRSVTPAIDWASYPEVITTFCERLRGVIIESGDAVDVIDRHDAPGTLFFVDPPYMHETRAMAGNRTYRHEMTERQHATLLDRLMRVEGFVILSGYPTETYEQALIPAGWEWFSRASSISGNRGTTMRTECVWINPRCVDALQGDQQTLFSYPSVLRKETPMSRNRLNYKSLPITPSSCSISGCCYNVSGICDEPQVNRGDSDAKCHNMSIKDLLAKISPLPKGNEGEVA